MKAIIICGLPAAGKTSVAHELGKRLNIPVLGASDILREMAVKRGYKAQGEDWWDTPEAFKFVKERDTNPDFDKEADRRLIERIDKGNIIVTSTTAPWLAKDGFKVWLDATPKKRAERMAKRDKTGVNESAEAVKFREENNFKLYKKLYGIELGKDLKPFDMIINTDDKSVQEITETILREMKKRKI